MKISLITINFHSQDYLEKFLASVEKYFLNPLAVDFTFEVLVVNNEPTPLSLLSDFSFKYTILNQKYNLGFGAANNLAAREATGDFLLFINPDILLTDDSLLQMFAYFADHPEIAAISPQIWLADQKRPQPWTCGQKTSLKSILFRNSFDKPWNKKNLVEVDWVSGTAMLVRKNDFLAAEGFDEKFFMYFEDQDLCLCFKKNGKKIVFYPLASVVHFDGKSWKNKACQKKSFYRSQNYFFQKHYGFLPTLLLRFLRLPMRTFYWFWG